MKAHWNQTSHGVQSTGSRRLPGVRRLSVVLLAAGLLGMGSAPGLAPCQAAAERVQPRKLPVHQPEQITFEAEPVLYGAVSQDGKWLVYASGRGEFSDLWLRSADPAQVVLPRRLTFDPASEVAPAFSPDGRKVAYVGTGHDVKGDVYLLDLDADPPTPLRLTGRDTADGFPCFGPDGRTLYFHQARPDQAFRQLVAIDLTQVDPKAADADSRGVEARGVSTGSDGSFPVVSPDGDRLAFVSNRQDPGGDIFVLELKSGRVFPLTAGNALDLFPAWSPDGRQVYFSRVAIDTNADGRVDLKDNAAVYRVRVAADLDPPAPAYPLTSFDYPSLHPQIGGARLFFLSSRKEVSNVWSLPLEGEIPLLESSAEQLRLAEDLARRVPPDPFLTLLGYYHTLERSEADAPLAGQSAYEIGRIYLELGLTAAAAATFEEVSARYAGAQPWEALARIAARDLDTRRRWDSAETSRQKARALGKSLAELAQIANRHRTSTRVGARSLVTRAHLLLELGNDSQSLLEAIRLLDQVVADYPSERLSAAEAAFLKAEAYDRVGMRDKVQPAYLTVVDRYGDVEPWAERAVKRILETAVAAPEPTGGDSTVRQLQAIVEENRHVRPILAMGALNRIGDIRFAADEWSQAKEAYGQVLVQFPQNTTQRAAARLALAEILYREERFSQALDLYEREIDSRLYEDPIYRLARAGYITKSIEAGEYLYRLGEISSARSVFKDLLVYDDGIIEAHRGYIKCAAAQNDIPGVLAAYRARLNRQPQDPVALYATGLCLTYVETPKAFEEARDLILRAIAGRGQVEYFHQTLGYVLEIQETVYGQEGRLETALESYQKAYFLNEPQRNPTNAANLLLNLGNGYFLLGQYPRGFQFYSQRLASGVPFDNIETEILFYRRLGASAFQVRESEQTIQAFTKAIALIRTRLDPRQASEAFDRLSRYTVDRILTPAARESQTAVKAKTLAREQSDINGRLSRLTQGAVEPPPGAVWDAYKQGLEGLVAEQRRLNASLVALARESASTQRPGAPRDAQAIQALQQDLKLMARRVSDALTLPERLAELNVELTDRLGLAYQEAGDWNQAAETFETVFALNQRLGLVRNLARNRRSVAYNRYMLAGLVSGAEQGRLLTAAEKDFAEAAALVERYGVAGKPAKRPQEALVNISLAVALDDVGATQAAHGFSAPQEKRLAEAFIGRIKTELGETRPAYETLQRQLAQYPTGQPVADKDVYGVSLLFHRAGHLAAALGSSREAFDHFRQSADLSLRMGQGISASINAGNMAHLLARSPASTPDYGRLQKELEDLDRKVTAWLGRTPALPTPAFNATYHNTLGVYFLELPVAAGKVGALEAAVVRMRRLQLAAAHFMMGLKALEPGTPGDKGADRRRLDRHQLYLLAGLHLNMAHVASALGEGEQARDHLQQGLELSQSGLFPDLQWRALARLGRLEEALEVLSRVSVLRAGSEPLEIVTSFAPLVADLVRADKTEAAFNLAEKLSEIERVHRLAPLFIGPVPEGEQALYLSLYPRLLNIRQLRAQAESVKGETLTYLTERLNREQELLAGKIGENRQGLPSLAALSPTAAVQDQIVILLGLALQAEATAEQRVGSTGEAQALQDQYDNLLAQYREVLQATAGRTADFEPEGILALFGPRPVEAIDVMENLPEGGTLLRLFPMPEPETGFLAFRLTADRIQASVVGAEAAGSLSDTPTYVAYEDLAALPALQGATYALSATHLVRSIFNRRPFKETLLALTPESSPASVTAGLEAYDVRTIAPSAPVAEILDALSGIHTLWVDSPAGVYATVPTRAGAVPRNIPGLQLDQGRTLPLIQLAGRLSAASLVLLPHASLAEAYTAGHLLSLYGCPAVIVPRRPAGEPAALVQSFLAVYRRQSTVEALAETLAAAAAPEAWMLLGHRGMNPDEALAFARQNFARYVKAAQAALTAERPLEALSLFENGIAVAKTSEEFTQYLPDLYRFSRESAYRGENLTKALHYARALADLAAEKAPDSELHAEALLRLGLLQARMEQYDRAVPTLEESLQIISNLENYDQAILTLDTVGVVLENATEYDRALDKFMSAVRLSQSRGKGELLAQQYINTGRIYDLRLSQYARAKANYAEALRLYRESGQWDQTARTLVDLGRCDRLLGNFDAADRNYAEALRLLTAHAPENLQLKSRIRIEQANNAWFQARYQEAFQLQQETLQLARQDQWSLGQIMALNTSGLIWWTLADHPRALRDLEAALKLARGLDARSDEVATTLNNIGLIHREAGRYEKALEIFDQALAIDRKLKSRWAVAYDLRNQALTLHQMKRYAEAVPLFEEAVREAHAIGNRINEAKALLGLGQTLQALGEDQNARLRLEESLALSQAMSVRETEWRSLYALAQLELKAGRQPEAIDLLKRAVQVIEGMRADLKIDQLKEGFITNKMAVYETLVGVLVDRGQTVEAFDMAERSRARNFIDLLGNQRLTLRNTVEEALYTRQLTLRTRILEHEALVAQATETAERTAYQETLARLNDDYRDLMLEIQLKNPQLAAVVSVNPLTADRVRALVEPGVALLTYYVLPREILCWIVTAGGVDLVRTPVARDLLGQTVFDYRRMIQNLEPLEDPSRQLFDWLLRPVIPRLAGSATVGIIPHGPLHYLSFATLSDGDRFLIDQFPLFYLPSASVFGYTIGKRGQTKKGRILAIGNPALEDSALDLPFAEQEVGTIHWNFPDTTLLTGTKATESWVVQHIGEYGIIHLASHGEFDPVNPLFSAVKLRKDDRADGDLNAAEVFGLEINADLVVLSACQTGIGKVTDGDEVIGLNRAYFYAGTHAIISSLWRVSDLSTAILVKHFYRQYQENNKGASLRQAMLHVKNRYPHPGYWGAFILVGDYL